MTLGQVYTWETYGDEFTGGRVVLSTVPLHQLRSLDDAGSGLGNRFVEIANAGQIIECAAGSLGAQSVPVGNARPDSTGDLIFDPGNGGCHAGAQLPHDPELTARDITYLRQRVDSVMQRDQCIAAGHFGEVNTYYHITAMAERVDEFLERLGAPSLPKVKVLVDAHTMVPEAMSSPDAPPACAGQKWHPVRGSRYRLPSASVKGRRANDVWRTGEIQLGPGLRLTRNGWLARRAGTPYYANASHIAGIIYHEYARHMARYTADFQANGLRRPDRQSNFKSATEWALGDFWAASMLDTPHFLCWHQRHDGRAIHARSLASNTSMDRFDQAGTAKARRSNGTILAAALWKLRQAMQNLEPSNCELLVLGAMVSMGRLVDDAYRPRVKATVKLRDGFDAFAACLHHADRTLLDGRHGQHITSAMSHFGIGCCAETLDRLKLPSAPALRVAMANTPFFAERIKKIRALSSDAIIPNDNEFLHPDQLEKDLQENATRGYDLVAVGDLMTGSRMRHRVKEHGPNYPFSWVRPLLARAAIVMGNLEGPFARHAKKENRNYSYKVDPQWAPTLRRAGFNVLTLANNHLQDCGRGGVVETLETIERQGIAAIGGGKDEASAHAPAIIETRSGRFGLLGYYWNRRTAARGNLPGSARDLPELVARDITKLRRQVDRVVVTVHWGVPYEREPSAADRVKAHHFIDCGADIVIGHHPHIMQPLEVYRGRPIFYSIGNFAFGSGNSRAESLVLAVRFLDDGIEVDVMPAYVRNRDPRVDYQPKLICAEPARQTLERLASMSGEFGKMLKIREFYGRLHVPPLDAGKYRAPLAACIDPARPEAM